MSTGQMCRGSVEKMQKALRKSAKPNRIAKKSKCFRRIKKVTLSGGKERDGKKYRGGEHISVFVSRRSYEAFKKKLVTIKTVFTITLCCFYF